MNTTLIYLLQVNVGVILFYLFYRLFFAGDTFWKTRRLYLLLSIGASFAYPLLSIESWLSQPEPMQTTLVRMTTLPEIVISPAQQASTISIENILIGTYLLVMLALVTRMLAQLFAIFRIRLAGKITVLQGTRVIAVEREISPFSFFGVVFINPALHTETEIRQILAHELTHARQWHSLDVFVGEFLSIAFWINPAVWLLKREIRQNLEFLADHQVLRSGHDPKHYQYHLLQLCYQSPDIRLGNQFNVSPLKKRIMMMNKQNSNKAAILKYMLIVPLVLSLVLVANAQNVVKKTKSTTNAKKTVVSAADTTKKGIKKTVQFTPPQNKTVKFTPPVVKKEQVSEKDGNKVYDVVEKMPQYPGGEKALLNYIGANLRYPTEAVEKRIQGTVIIRFVVNASGKVINPEILRGVDTSLDKAGLAVVKSLPNWIPAEQNGKKVSVYYTLPIRFKLDESKPIKKTTK
jgi:TonB family protein